MTVYIAHKDTLLTLTRLQRNFIKRFNEGKALSEYLFPHYPLFAFDASNGSDDIGKKICSCAILPPKASGSEIYFPFVIAMEDGTKKELKIVFATSKGGISEDDIKKAAETDSATFPLQLRIFRKANAVLEDNSWQIFDEKWIKVKP